jgi:hypothetical protein
MYANPCIHGGSHLICLAHCQLSFLRTRPLKTDPFQLISGKMQLSQIRRQSNDQWYCRMPGRNASSCIHQHFTAFLSSSDRCFSKESVVPCADQNVGAAYPTDITATVDFPTQEWSFAPQALVRTQIQGSLDLAKPFLRQYQNAEYAPRYEAADSLQVEMGMPLNEGRPVSLF